MYEKYNWRFNKEVTKGFDEHVIKSVPLYELFHQNIVDMSVYFTQIGTNVIDIGTSTGTLIHSIRSQNAHKSMKYTGIDIEESMIEEAKERYEDIDFRLADAIDFDYSNSSVIASVLSLQFMGKDERRNVLKSAHDGLIEDGALFIVEKIKTDIIDVHDIYNDIYYDFKRVSLSDEDILNKNISLRGVQKPITLEGNIENLRNVGFKKIDVFMKYNNFVGIVAIK